MVTITRGGYAKRTSADLYRAQKRGGKGVRGAALRATTWSSTSSPPRTTTGSCSSPTKAGSTAPRRTSCPSARDAKGKHVAGLLLPAGRADRPGTDDARLRPGAVPGAGHARRAGEEDPADRVRLPAVGLSLSTSRGRRRADRRRPGSPRTTCCWCPGRVSRSASSPTTKRCARWAGPRQGVTGMKFRGGDELLAMAVIRAGSRMRSTKRSNPVRLHLTDGGYAKRTRLWVPPAGPWRPRHEGDVAVTTSGVRWWAP